MNFGVIYHFYQKINKILKIERLLANLLDKFQYHIHMKNLKQPLNHGLVLKKVKLNKTVWLKPYTDMNTDLRKEAKNDFEKVLLN